MILNFDKNLPFVEGVSLNEIILNVDTPFYLYSQKSISDSYNKLKKSLNAKIFFAVKANSNQSIISIMKSLGAGADVVSGGELKRALTAGVNPNNIIFEGVGKSVDDIKYAIDKNIRQINIESLDELLIINNIANSLSKKANIGIRVNPDINAETLDKITTGRKTDKFGITENLIPEVCEQIKKMQNVNFKGISSHIGSQIHNLKIFEEVFKKINKISNIIESCGLSFKFLDLGGGFGVNYKEEKEFDLENFSNLIKKYYDNTKYEISFEPGRYLVAKSGILITKILNKKTNGSKNYLITDAGMQTFLRPSLYNAFHKIIPISKENNGKKNYTIAGPICESSDILAKDIEMPNQDIGNYLAICDVGAYGFVMASNYNSISLPAEVLINNNNYSIIRKKEKISSVIEKDIVPNWLKN